MSGKFLAAFSNTGHYYAHISDDGKLRIWDVHSCILKQEYTPDVHLTSPFTDLHWISSSKKVNLSSGNRKRKNTSIEDNDNEYLLLGSRSSDVFLYSVSSYSIVNTFKNGHTSRINNISWNRNVPDVFFTCSQDQFVVQWSIENCSVKRKWKCGKASCIVVSDDGQTIVTALKEIKWWDVSGEKEKLLKTFLGQSTDIFSLTFIRINDEPCVLSAASGNRLIHAWLLNPEIEDRCALATFSMDDALISLSACEFSTDCINILATSKTGVLHVYRCTKNGKKLTKPVKPKLSIQIASEPDNEKSQVEQIPIVGATFCNENTAHIAYGCDAILSFEKLELNTTEKCMFIVRQDPKKKLSVSKEQSANKILPTSSNKNVQYVPPDAVNGFFPSTTKKPLKRTLNAEKSIDVPLEQRLENLIVDVPSTVSVPTSDSLVHLLLQGLKSKDSRILHDVLLNKEEKVIRTTVSRLPVEAIVPLCVELITLLQGKRSGNDFAVKWLRYVLMMHSAHLISNPDVTEIFAPIFPIIESRLNMVGPLYRLIGRLDMMVQQIQYRMDESERSLQSVSLLPKFIYQDEDSDEEEKEDNNVLNEEPMSDDDSDDHWDEMSEIDVDSGQDQGPDIEMDHVDF